MPPWAVDISTSSWLKSDPPRLFTKPPDSGCWNCVMSRPHSAAMSSRWSSDAPIAMQVSAYESVCSSSAGPPDRDPASTP